MVYSYVRLGMWMKSKKASDLFYHTAPIFFEAHFLSEPEAHIFVAML